MLTFIGLVSKLIRNEKLGNNNENTYFADKRKQSPPMSELLKNHDLLLS